MGKAAWKALSQQEEKVVELGGVNVIALNGGDSGDEWGSECGCREEGGHCLLAPVSAMVKRRGNLCLKRTLEKDMVLEDS